MELSGSLVGLIEVWGLVSFFGCGATLRRLIPFNIMWLAWKERNDRIFRWESTDIDDMFSSVLLRVAIF